MSGSDVTFHYPPELLTLLVDTIPRLFRGKNDVLLFFQGAGVPTQHLADLRAQLAANRQSLNKFDLVRTVLTRLNQDGERALRVRREIVKRVVEFEDFTGCWDSDRLKAQGLVHEIRRVVGVKDAFTRMKDEREHERAQHRRAQDARAAELAARAAKRAALKSQLFSLFAETNPWKRGKQLETALNQIFAGDGLLIREAFVLRGDEGEGVVEQIDGVIELDGRVYLAEMKWYGKALGPGDVSQHLVRIMSRSVAAGLINFRFGLHRCRPLAVQGIPRAQARRAVPSRRVRKGSRRNR